MGVGADLTAADGDPTRTLIRQVLGAVSQFEKSVIVLKLRAARERKRGEGERVEGRKPFGHYPGEARVLETIRDLRIKRGGKRLGAVRIAKKLNEMGLPSRMGRPWSSYKDALWARFRSGSAPTPRIRQDRRSESHPPLRIPGVAYPLPSPRYKI